MTSCSSCGHESREGQRFCTRCGGPLTLAPPPPPVPGEPQTSGYAIVGFVLSLIPVCLHLVGVVLGAIALVEISRRPAQVRGRGLAIAAIAIGLGWALLAVGGAVGIPRYLERRARARQEEPKRHLALLGSAYQEAKAQHGSPPSTFEELGVTLPAGRQYAYYFGDDVLEPDQGPVPPLPLDLPESEDAVFAAVGDVDDDEDLDVWVVGAAGEVRVYQDDVGSRP